MRSQACLPRQVRARCRAARRGPHPGAEALFVLVIAADALGALPTLLVAFLAQVVRAVADAEDGWGSTAWRVTQAAGGQLGPFAPGPPPDVTRQR